MNVPSGIVSQVSDYLCPEAAEADAYKTPGITEAPTQPSRPSPRASDVHSESSGIIERHIKGGKLV